MAKLARSVTKNDGSHVSHTLISRVINGREGTSFLVAQQIADALGVRAEILFMEGNPRDTRRPR